MCYDSRMNKTTPEWKRRCKAMLDAGIEDPNSPEGILFCAGSRDGTIPSQCPYDYCVVLEHEATVRQLNSNKLTAFIKDLKAHGISSYDIALITDRSLRTVERHLRL